MAAQEVEQRQQRQAEDRKIIALDALEQLRAQSLELIDADRRQRVVAERRQIAIEETIAESAHGEARTIHTVPDCRAVLNHGDGAHQLVSLAAQRGELRARLAAIARLVEPDAGALEHLVGADNQCIGMARRNAQRLHLGQRRRTGDGISARGAEGALHLVLIDAGGIAQHLDPGAGEDGGPRRARRCQHDPPAAETGHVSWPWRRASSLRMAAAVSSIERRVTSITGQWWSAKSRRACATSRRTASTSV